MVCAAALEVQRIIQQQDLVTKAQCAAKFLESLLRKAFATHPQIGNIRGRGLFWSVSRRPRICIYSILQPTPAPPHKPNLLFTKIADVRSTQSSNS